MGSYHQREKGGWVVLTGVVFVYTFRRYTKCVAIVLCLLADLAVEEAKGGFLA